MRFATILQSSAFIGVSFTLFISCLTFLKYALLSDTELAEDVGQDFGVGDLSGYFAKGGKTVLQVHREEFAGKSVRESLLHADDGVMRAGDCLIMTRIGNHDSSSSHRFFRYADEF